jgi:hypothetical protein
MVMQKKGGETVNKGPGARPDRPDDFDIAGNAKARGEDPSPDDRERGETSLQKQESRVDR